MWHKSVTALLLSCLLFLLNIPVRAEEEAVTRTVQFSGYTWEVRSGGGGPGPNRWDPNNVWVDSNGYLHLKISKVNGQWRSAELYMTQLLGFGTYQWQLNRRVDQLDRNVVLGLFNYTTPDVGPDGTNEIDIEFARWGNAAYPIGNYTVYPARTGFASRSNTFNFTLNGDYTTHRFAWSSNRVLYQSLHGHTDTNTNEFKRWSYAPTQPQQRIPQAPLPVHINLWLFEGRAPTNGQEVEMIIEKFTYTPGPAITSAAEIALEPADDDGETVMEQNNRLFLPVVINQ